MSNPGDEFMTFDIKYVYYDKPLSEYEYIRMAQKDIPTEIIDQYSLNVLASEGWVYMEIQKK